MQTIAKRHGNKWCVNELLTLQREYELLELTVQEIANRHQRSVDSILYKLEDEGFITSWNEARGFNSSLVQNTSILENVECVEEDVDEDYVDEEEEDDDDDDYDYVDDEDEDEDDDYVDDDDEEVSDDMTKLADRVWSLETSVNDIGTMVKQLFDSLVNTKPKKRLLV